MKEPLKIKNPPTDRQVVLLAALGHEVEVLHALEGWHAAFRGPLAQAHGVTLGRIAALEYAIETAEANRT